MRCWYPDFVFLRFLCLSVIRHSLRTHEREGQVVYVRTKNYVGVREKSRRIRPCIWQRLLITSTVRKNQNELRLLRLTGYLLVLRDYRRTSLTRTHSLTPHVHISFRKETFLVSSRTTGATFTYYVEKGRVRVGVECTINNITSQSQTPWDHRRTQDTRTTDGKNPK